MGRSSSPPFTFVVAVAFHAVLATSAVCQSFVARILEAAANHNLQFTR